MQITFTEEIFAEDTFAEFYFSILPQNSKIKFHRFLQIRTSGENKFHEISYYTFFLVRTNHKYQ